MSRCFPFPPPGYVLNGIRDEAMIVSIKGAKEKAKKEQRKKERKRDKKEKKDKKERKEKNKEKKDKKRKERDGKEGESEKQSHKRRRKEEGVKVKDSEVNCLEKSSLTVERELLQSTSQNSCDSTLNSNEMLPKQKEKQPLDGRHNNDSESIIRIRLPIRRQKDSEVMTTNKDQEKLCPSRGIKLDSSQLAIREPVNQHPCSTSAPEHASKPQEEKRKDPIFRGKFGKEKIYSTPTPEICQPTKSRCSCPPSVVLQFLNVVENWVPNTIESRVDLINSEDEECWWSMKKPSSPTERCKQLNRNNEIKQVGNSMGWPCARLLPEADVYALPYTVPF